MRAVDTNILARLVLGDDEVQADAAAAILEQPTWVSPTVWLELGWVLSKRLGLDRGVVGDAIETLLAIDTVHTSDREGMAWATERYRAGADWADMVHLVIARGVAASFATFDRHLAGQAGPDTPVPVETLPG